MSLRTSNMRFKVVLASVLLLGLPGLFAFQNCSNSSSPVAFSNARSQLAGGGDGRGEGFDGKPDTGSFYRMIPDHRCGDNVFLYDKIDVTSSQIKAVFIDATTCDKTEVQLTQDQIEYNGYNKDVMGYTDGVFEKKETPPILNTATIPVLETWCRTTDSDPYHGLDIIIHSNPRNNQIQADVVIGSSSGAKLVSVRQLPSQVVTRSLSQEIISYEGTGFQLKVDLAGQKIGNLKVPGDLHLMLDGQASVQSLSCRTAGTLDSKSQVPPLTCPDGFVSVSKLVGYSESDFCVAKYEAKANGNKAVSVPSGLPWVNVNRAEALQACQANGLLFDLISNDEWQTVARNIEGVSANWSGGQIGSSAGLNRGHSDNNPDAILAASSDDGQSCFGKSISCDLATWNAQRRTFILNNGGIVWDLSGNVIEWMKDDNALNYGPNSHISQITNGSAYLAQTKDKFGPAGNYVALNTSPYGGLGLFESGAAGSILRGGVWYWGADAGIFEATFTVPPSDRQPQVGFRCVYHP